MCDVADITGPPAIGYITSPNYPESYDHSALCVVHVTGTDPDSVHTSLMDLDVEARATVGCYDSLSLVVSRPYHDSHVFPCPVICLDSRSMIDNLSSLCLWRQYLLGSYCCWLNCQELAAFPRITTTCVCLSHRRHRVCCSVRRACLMASMHTHSSTCPILQLDLLSVCVFTQQESDNGTDI